MEDLETHYREETLTAGGGGRGASLRAVLDIDPGALPALTARLRGVTGVAEINASNGGRQIVLFLQGNSSREIRNFADCEIRPMPGVLRIKFFAIQEDIGNSQEPAAFEDMLRQYRGDPGMLIPMLQAAQESYGYLPDAAVDRISGVTGIPEAEIYGVITFYKQFRLKPLGKHVIRLCKGTACHVLGAEAIGQVISGDLGVESDETTEDGIFTYMCVACLGCCSLAPALMVDDQTFGRLTPPATRKLLRRYRQSAG